MGVNNREEGYINHKRDQNHANNLHKSESLASVPQKMREVKVKNTQSNLADNLKKMSFDEVKNNIENESNGRWRIEYLMSKYGIKSIKLYNKNLEKLNFPKVDENGNKHNLAKLPGQISIGFDLEGKTNISINPYDQYNDKVVYKHFDVSDEDLKSYVKGFDAILNLKTPDEAFGKHNFKNNSYKVSGAYLDYYEEFFGKKNEKKT